MGLVLSWEENNAWDEETVETIIAPAGCVHNNRHSS